MHASSRLGPRPNRACGYAVLQDDGGSCFASVPVAGFTPLLVARTGHHLPLTRATTKKTSGRVGFGAYTSACAPPVEGISTPTHAAVLGCSEVTSDKLVGWQGGKVAGWQGGKVVGWRPVNACVITTESSLWI